MDKLLQFQGVITKKQQNPSCKTLTMFDISDQGYRTRLNYFCNPQARTPRLLSDEKKEWFIKATYLHVPEVFQPLTIDTNGKNAIKYLSKKHVSGLMVTSMFTGSAEDNPIQHLMFNGYSALSLATDCGATFATNALGNADSTFFEFGNHYFAPISLTDGRTLYYAFEDLRIGINWVKYIEKKCYKVAVGIRDKIYSENIFGISISKSIYLVEVDLEEKNGKDYLVAKEYFDPLTGSVYNSPSYP